MDRNFDLLETLRKKDELKEQQDRKSTLSIKMDFVRSCMQIEGNLVLNSTTAKQNGSYLFNGYKRDNGDRIQIELDYYQTELISECHSIQELFDQYKEMEYFG